MAKTKTSTEVKARWNAQTYKTYRANLRLNEDKDLIDFVDKYKAEHDEPGRSTVTEIFRAGIITMMQAESERK